MRILLAAALVCALHSYSHAIDEDTKNMARAYPKQKDIPFHRNIQILNAQKFLRSIANAKHKLNYKKLHYQKAGGTYTVFPSIDVKSKKLSFSESPYFPIDDLFNHKPNRIFKKMLPDYGLLQPARYKRSANFANVSQINTHKTSRASNVNGKEIKRNINDGGPHAQVKNSGRKRAKHTQSETRKKRNRDPGSERNSKRKVNKRNIKNKPISNTERKADSKVVKGKISRGDAKHGAAKNNKEMGKSKKNLRSSNARGEDRKSRLKKRANNNNNNRKRSSKQTNRHRGVGAGRRLIAAKDALVEDYPYVASIQKNYEHWCAGALLNPRLVITTANCVWKSDQISRMKVRVGSRYSDRGGQVARIQELMRHSGWSIRHNPDNDVALMLLDRNIKFSNQVHGVDLPNRGMMPAFDDAWVTGWGSDRRDGMFQDRLTLQVYHARVIDRDKCNNITQRFGVYVTHNFFCMSQYGRRSPCTRDTGAPAVSDGVLWGLASWGLRKRCGTERFPAMFTYIASESIMNFIENVTHMFMSDKRIYPFSDRIRDYRIKALMDNKTIT